MASEMTIGAIFDMARLPLLNNNNSFLFHSLLVDCVSDDINGPQF
jgi:hypothetical protein